jgi:hypothetical protein
VSQRNTLLGEEVGGENKEESPQRGEAKAQHDNHIIVARSSRNRALMLGSLMVQYMQDEKSLRRVSTIDQFKY